MSAPAWHAFRKGRLQEAQNLAVATLAAQPGDGRSNLVLGLLALRGEQIEEASFYLTRALESDSQLHEAAGALATLLFHQRRFEEAENFARRAVALQPNTHEYLMGLGMNLGAQGRFAEAIPIFESAVKLDPNSPRSLDHLAQCYQYEGRDTDAEATFRTATTRGAYSVPVFLAISDLSAKRGDLAEAAIWAAHAVELEPQSGGARLKLAWRLVNRREFETAEAQFKAALALLPNDPAVPLGYGNFLQIAGRFGEAHEQYLAALQLDPNQSLPYVRLFFDESNKEDLSPLIDQAEKLVASNVLPPQDQVYLLYALGKAYSNRKESGKAMDQFDEAHRITLANHLVPKFDREAWTATVDEIIRHFSDELIGQHLVSGLESKQPIFVLGMPRSGTTLIDQILSSHPEVSSAGEYGFCMKESDLNPDSIQSYDLKSLKKVGRDYLRRLKQAAREGSRTIDKMPANYLMIGFIRAAFSNVRIVHARRDPIDTCLSIWSTPNQALIPWAHDRGDTVCAYRNYWRLMDHWRSVIPSENLLEVDYQNLVENSEPTIRKMIDFLGLEWSDACLHHEKNNQIVTTPSLWQVRQPIYRSSLGRREGLEDRLGEFAQLADLGYQVQA